MSGEIRQTLTLNAAPAEVFAALMEESHHTRFTGEPARIDARLGGGFTCYGDYINGITLELHSPSLIVQAWRTQNWPKEIWSLVTFKLSPLPGGKTKLRFTQVGVPARDHARKTQGWRTHYWQPLKKYLERNA